MGVGLEGRYIISRRGNVLLESMSYGMVCIVLSEVIDWSWKNVVRVMMRTASWLLYFELQ